MRRVLACGILASVAFGDYRVDRMEDHLNAGRTKEALDEATPEVMDLLVIGDFGREINVAMIAHNERYGGKDGPCGKVIDLAREVRKRALEGSRPIQRILAAEVLVLEGRTARARKKEDWLTFPRNAAAELAAWYGGDRDRDWAGVRAVEILAETAALKGAPAEQLIEEAKAIALKDARGESVDSPVYLAYRLALAEHHVAARRAKEAGDALKPFDELAATLGGRDDDLERATIFNLAVALSRREKLPLKAEFKTTRHRSAGIDFDLPVSRLWDEPRDTWEDGAMIYQQAPDGRPLRKLYFEHYNLGEPWDHNTPAPRNIDGLGQLRFGAIRNFDMGKMTKNIGPKRGTFTRNLPAGLLLTIEGIDKRDRPLEAQHFLFEDVDRQPGWFEISTWAFGTKPPADPLFDAVVASIK